MHKVQIPADKHTANTSTGRSVDSLMMLTILLLGAMALMLYQATPHIPVKKVVLAPLDVPAFNQKYAHDVPVLLHENEDVGYRSLALKQSMDKLNRTFEETKALNEVATLIYAGQHGVNVNVNDERSRNLLIKAGYRPTPVPKKQDSGLKKAAQQKLVQARENDDVKFAGHVMQKVVQKEVQDFFENVSLITEVGRYVSSRIGE